MSFLSRLNFFKKQSDKELRSFIKELLGFYPTHVSYYATAFSHSSKFSKVNENNERLEFLGDAIIDSVVSEYLFRQYPFKGEGFLTQMRAKLVSRKMLNRIGNDMHLLTVLDTGNNQLNPNMAGNALEALIGAIYLDKGYAKTHRVVLEKIYKSYVDLSELENSELNYKSILVEWAQGLGKKLSFVTVEEKVLDGGKKEFICAVQIDGDVFTKATGSKKKTAEKIAAEKAYDKLELSRFN